MNQIESLFFNVHYPSRISIINVGTVIGSPSTPYVLITMAILEIHITFTRSFNFWTLLEYKNVRMHTKNQWQKSAVVYANIDVWGSIDWTSNRTECLKKELVKIQQIFLTSRCALGSIFHGCVKKTKQIKI